MKRANGTRESGFFGMGGMEEQDFGAEGAPEQSEVMR